MKAHAHPQPHAESILPDLSATTEQQQEVYEDKHPDKVSGFERFKLGYLRLLDNLLGRRALVISVYGLVCALLIGVGFTQIGQDMMPRQHHARQFQVRIVGPQGLRIERTEALTKRVIDQIGALGGDGGLIALDASGNIADPFNSQGMKRAWLRPDGEIGVEVFGR